MDIAHIKGSRAATSPPVNQERHVSIQLQIDATVKITGTVTGLQYVFRGAGAIVEVDLRDKDELLNKKRGRSCCGGQSGKSIFVLV